MHDVGVSLHAAQSDCFVHVRNSLNCCDVGRHGALSMVTGVSEMGGGAGTMPFTFISFGGGAAYVLEIRRMYAATTVDSETNATIGNTSRRWCSFILFLCVCAFFFHA